MKRYPGEHIIGQPNMISLGTVDGLWRSAPRFYWFPFSLVTESHCHVTASLCLIGKFIRFFSPHVITGRSTKTATCGCRTAHSFHSQLPFWRNAMESSWGFLCADAVHLHCEETILGHHFLLSMAHSAMEPRGKSRHTGYSIGQNYPETVGYFWKAYAHIHLLLIVPGSLSFTGRSSFGNTHPTMRSKHNIRNTLQGARNRILYNNGTELHLPNIYPDTDSPITMGLNEENIFIWFSKGEKLINLPKCLFPDKAIL